MDCIRCQGKDITKIENPDAPPDYQYNRAMLTVDPPTGGLSWAICYDCMKLTCQGLKPEELN